MAYASVKCEAVAGGKCWFAIQISIEFLNPGACIKGAGRQSGSIPDPEPGEGIEGSACFGANRYLPSVFTL